jgi:ADP-heptose:LPS heptosyltransferase/glycosyltransferase involved in cell wall biosynthesis
LADDLIAAGYNVVQIGAFSDKKLSNPAVIDATGKLTFKQHVEFFKHFSAYIGNDSGPAYLAAESGIPCLIIMGSTQNKGLGKGPSVGPCHPNVAYIEPQRPNNPLCTPVPCYTHCQIGKAGGCVVDVAPKDVKRIVWQMLGGAMSIGGATVFKADSKRIDMSAPGNVEKAIADFVEKHPVNEYSKESIEKIKKNALDIHTTMDLKDFSIGPKLVVGMLTYNEEKYIKYSLGAVYDYVDHIIIVDSFSTDNTIKYIRELDKEGKITIIQRTWNNNYAEARNTYLEYIRENICPTNPNLYYFRIDADEVYYSSKVEELKNIILQNAEANAFRFNFYTFEGDHEHLSEKNPIETRACVFKYSPDIQYVSALHEMPVKGVGQKVLYTHNLSHDAALGVRHIDEFWYCHFAWCDVDRCFTKAKNYTEHYVAQGTETKERLNSIENNKDSWWWNGHSSNYEFKEQYPEIFDKLGHLDVFKNSTGSNDKLTNGKFKMVDGKLVFETGAPVELVSEEPMPFTTKLVEGKFAMRDGRLMFDSDKPVEPAPLEEQKPIETQRRKLSAFTIVKNAVKYDYPIVESINSVLPFVDEYIINVGTPDDDGTTDLLSLHFSDNPKVKIFFSEWEGRDQGIKFLTSQTNKAKDACSYDWALYVQADELYLEEDFDKMHSLIERYDKEAGVLAFSFDFLHFDGDYASINPNSYKKEIRLVRKNSVASIEDAVTFGIKQLYDVPVSSIASSYVNSDVRVFHYGWVREPKKMTEKLVNFDSFYHSDEELKEMHKDFDVKHRDGYDYGKRESHIKYTGPHPDSAHERIRKFESDHGDICKNFVFRAKKNKKYIVERTINGQSLSWENDLISDEYVVIGDHMDVPGLGDTILNTAVVREVNKKFPDKKIILKVLCDTAPYENNPRIHRIEKGLIPHPIDIPTGHYIEQKCRYFGIDNPDIKGEIFITDKERAVAEDTLKILSGARPTIMLCANTSSQSKDWPKENWVKIVEVLSEKYDVYQIEQHIRYSKSVDRPEENGHPFINMTIPNARQELRNAAGGLRKIMAIMSLSKRYIGMATGFINIAACFGENNIVLQHDGDADIVKLRNIMSKTTKPYGLMDMNQENVYKNFPELRPEWVYPGSKYFDKTYDIDRLVEEIKKMWMQ